MSDYRCRDSEDEIPSLREILYESRVAEQESRIGKRLIDKIREQEHEERYMF